MAWAARQTTFGVVRESGSNGQFRARISPDSARTGSKPISSRTSSTHLVTRAGVAPPGIFFRARRPRARPRWCASRSIASSESGSPAPPTRIRASSSWSRAGTVTPNSRRDRRYSFDGRPAPRPVRPDSRRYWARTNPAPTSLSKWKAAMARLIPTAAAASSRPMPSSRRSTYSKSRRRVGSRSVASASSRRVKAGVRTRGC